MSTFRVSGRIQVVSLLAVLGCLGASCPLALASSGSSGPTISQAAASVSASVDPFMKQILSEYASSSLGPFANGEWADSESTTWSVDNGGPATAAATLYVLGGESNALYLDEAEETINTAIADQQASDGAFEPPSNDTTSIPTSTAWFGVEMGTTYELLAPYLDTATKEAWQASLASAASWIISSKNLTWYANGNINLTYTELMWLAWQDTGESQFLTAYNESWAFVMDPPQNEFFGNGWVTATAPTQADGSDGEGYFTETGAAGTGWDPYYSMIQLDVLSRMYLLSGDPRALQALNMIMNEELPLISTTDWALNQSDGTRHTGTQGATGFLSSAFAVLALEGGRSDLLADVLPQLAWYQEWYEQTGNADSASFRRAFGNSIATIALAAALANPAQENLVSSYGMLGSSSQTATPITTAHSPATIPVGSLTSTATTTSTTVATTSTTTKTTSSTTTTKTAATNTTSSTTSGPTTKTTTTPATNKATATTTSRKSAAAEAKARAALAKRAKEKKAKEKAAKERRRRKRKRLPRNESLGNAGLRLCSRRTACPLSPSQARENPGAPPSSMSAGANW
jgi:hypothetical protein